MRSPKSQTRRMVRLTASILSRVMALLVFGTVAAESKTMRCWAKWTTGESFYAIFSIDPEGRKVERLSGDQGLVYEVDVESGEISFVASFSHGNSFTRFSINRFTLQLAVREMDASLEGSDRHWVFTEKRGRGSSGSGYCEETALGVKKL